ncbi:MAG: glycosyltransferase family 4 protein [Prevotella sp.]|nr:glycosyltransferase family 4 protein [Prevotella sp.]
MIIGFDAKRIVRNGTGLGSYGRTLVNDLLRRHDPDMQYLLYAPDEGRDDLRNQIIEGATFRYPAAPFFSRLLPLNRGSQRGSPLWRSYGIVNDLLRDGVQLYHGLSGELPIGIRKKGIRTVVTIHDLIFLRHPEYYHWIDTRLYAWKFRKTLQEADRIIAISERTKQDIMELGNVPEERIRLIYQSCAPRFSSTFSEAEKQQVRSYYDLPERFVLNVGTIERRKNLLLAAKALELLPSDIHLVAVGRQTKYAQELPQNNRIHLLSGVPDTDLAIIYSLAEAFVYPSRYEGFGIPIIEAIAAGLPVVACTGSCLEEAGGPDCLYVDPDDVEGMAAAILSVLDGADGRTERIRLSQQYIERFRGTDVASQVLDVYRELL